MRKASGRSVASEVSWVALGLPSTTRRTGRSIANSASTWRQLPHGVPGFGPRVATTSAARTLAALEIIAGVVLFLFAFAEIASYDPEAEQALAGNEEADPNVTQRNEGGKS